MLPSVSEQNFTKEVLESPVPVLVNFWAPWCGLCRNIQPLLLQFQADCSEQIKLVGVNADENFKLSNSHRLTSLPTLLLVKEGKVIKRLDSFHGRDDLQRALEEIRITYAADQNNYAAVLSGSLPAR